MLNTEQIKEIIPHRDPMLLVDEVEVVGSEAIGYYTVRGDEYFLKGHFPGQPVVPGVILCEMMAQAACLLVLSDKEKSIPYLTGLNDIKFRAKVLPGDQITFRSHLIAHKGSFYFVSSIGRIGDKICVSGELSFTITSEK